MSRQEIEIKHRLEGPADYERLRAALAELGAQYLRVQREDDTLFDTPSRELAARSAVLRLRVIDGGPTGKLTFKGPSSYSGGIKTRREVEIEVADVASTRALLEALGYQSTLDYGKVRELWHASDVEVALDTLDFGHFCELEGPREAIIELGRRLGLDPARAEPANYPDLVARYQANPR